MGGLKMNMSTSRIIWGILLVLAGLFLLLQNLGLLAFNLGALLVPFFFGAGGLIFLAVSASNRDHWWSLIPGFVLLSIGGLIALDQVAPRLASTWGGSFFLGGISLAFWLIFLTQREHWWALIPAGVLTTLAAVAGLAQLTTGTATGSLFFLGMAATFALVYLFPGPQGRQGWALLVAGVMLVLGTFTLLANAAVLQYVWPLALILLGAYLLLRSGREGKEAAEPKFVEKSPKDLE
jgi:hypothetical protein